MWMLFIYLIVVVPLLICNSFNKRKIKTIFSSIDKNESIQLDDSDLMPILRTDYEKQTSNTETKNKFISLQKSLLLSSLLCGIHTLTVCILSYQLFNSLEHNILLLLLWVAGFVYVVNFVSKLIFMSGLKEILKTIYLSPGYSVSGKTFFSFNPLFGFKYFAFSEQLDDKFGLFDNKSKDKKSSDE